MHLNKELLKGNTETFILSLLSQQDMYGYEITQKIKEKTNHQFELKEGTVYVVLKRLEDKTYIHSYWKDEKSGGGKRKHFSLTPNGQTLLSERIHEWHFIQNVMNIFLNEVKK